MANSYFNLMHNLQFFYNYVNYINLFSLSNNYINVQHKNAY